MIYCAFKYQAGYYDYLEFEFYNLNSKQRKTFLTRGINNEIVYKYNDKRFFDLIDNKIKFNKMFDKYLKRDWIYLKEIKQLEKFIKGKEYIIVKPVDGEGGQGVNKLKTNVDINELYKSLIKNKQLLIEEVIVQDKRLDKLYSESVNTIRIFTFFDGEEVHVLNQILKIGNGGVVDNFSAGGMYTFLDITGKAIVSAIDKEDNIYDTHPISKTNIIGFQVPNFDKAIRLVKDASKEIPEIKYIGWDVALSDKGAVLVEGNCFPGVFQVKASLNEKKEGILPLYRKYMDI